METFQVVYEYVRVQCSTLVTKIVRQVNLWEGHVLALGT